MKYFYFYKIYVTSRNLSISGTITIEEMISNPDLLNICTSQVAKDNNLVPGEIVFTALSLLNPPTVPIAPGDQTPE